MSVAHESTVLKFAPALVWLMAFFWPFLAVSSTVDTGWVTTWAAPADLAGPTVSGQTVRQVVRVSIGGSSLRIRLSNLMGTGPVTIGPLRVASHAGGSAIEPGTDRGVTFAGKPAVAIAKGGEALSDPVRFDVSPLQQLAVSLYVAPTATPATIHNTAMQTAYLAPGDVTAASSLTTAQPDTSRYFLTDVDVAAANAALIVAMGDSITDGVGSSDDGNARWPDALAERLRVDATLASVAVVNSGISGNRILNDGAKPFIGPSMLSRFDRDALDKPGVRWLVLLAGINDISAAEILDRAQDRVSEEQIIAGMQQLIARAHDKGVKVLGGTLTPRAGARWSSPEAEAKRQAVNAWIRTSRAFDAVVDFDRAVRDPAEPTRLLPSYDSGDHSHPNDAGFKAMAAAIDLELFRRAAAYPSRERR